jgi:hypothetical protein
MAKVELVVPNKIEYPLRLDQLIGSTFYEAGNGTVVFVGRGELGNNNPLNIENGIGGYKSDTGIRFRKLPKGTVITVTI